MAAGGYEAIGKRNLDAETVVVPIVFGFFFGFFVSKGVVYLPSVVLGQLQLTYYLLIKFYLAALAGSLVAGSIISLSGTDARRRFDASRITASNGPVSVAIGAILIGCGMVLTGSEPSTAFVQAGTGVWSGFYVLLGGLIAVFVYGYLYKEVFSKVDQQGRPSRNALDEAFKCEYWHVALPLGTGIAALCYFVETSWGAPWRSELPASVFPSQTWVPALHDAAWSPYYVGALVGILQIPLRTSLFCLLDSTHAYISSVCVPLKVVADKLNCNIPGWFTDHSSTAGLWALFFFGSAAGGAYLSGSLGSMLSFETGFGVKWCLAGGFCLVLGSLVAGACPTGLVVSGCSDLNIMSFLAAALIFGSGIVLATIFGREGIHPERSSAAFLS